MFRLHIDIPLDCSEEDAATFAKAFVAEVIELNNTTPLLIGKKFQYRLANDDDRCVKNYLIKDENNHVANKISVIEM